METEFDLVKFHRRAKGGVVKRKPVRLYPSLPVRQDGTTLGESSLLTLPPSLPPKGGQPFCFRALDL